MSIRVIACINADGMLAGFRPPKDDLQRFAALTIGGTVIMGRKTWESLPDRMRPLPHRANVIVTRRAGYGHPPGVVCFVGLNALTNAMADYCMPRDSDAWIIGGGEIYAQAMPVADLVYLSQTDDRGGDVSFPLAAMNRFERLVEQQHPTHRFSIWRRRA